MILWAVRELRPDRQMRKTVKAAPPPEGFRYEEGLLLPVEESELIRHIEKLPLKEFEFHGYTGKRRVVSFGWHYDFGSFSLNRVEDIPDFLKPLRQKAAVFAGSSPEDFPHVLVTEYTLLRGPGRTEWEHSIPAVENLRYSITFRSVLREKLEAGS